MNHACLSSAIPFSIALIIYLARGRASVSWLILTPLSMAVFSVWALVPDLPRLFGDMALYDRLNLDPRCNIFFYHHAIDQTETDTPLWGALIAVYAGLLLWIAWRELHREEKNEA